MQLFLCRRTVISACLIALGLGLAAPAAGATALPERPIKKTGFRLFARASGSIRVNQVQCGLLANGQICVDSTGSSTIPGSVWPKGTNNQYTFNSGISLAGVVGDEMPQWAGDTTGAFFFEGTGFFLNGDQVEPIYNFSDPNDAAQWPDFAKVPSRAEGDSVAAIYDDLLQGQNSASQGDVYMLYWDGNPARVNGRTHPMGVVVETRGLAWNYPAGNQDIVYFIYTLYNISSVREEDYITSGIRKSLRDKLLTQARTFQASNEAAFGVDIPEGGYTLNNVFMDFAADQDVADATVDFATFNNLFNLAVTYENRFTPLPGNVFEAALHAPPFLPGPGFVGTKYLRSPILEDGTEAGTVLAGLTTNRGAFPDPNDVNQLYRYISGNLNPSVDPSCNTGDPKLTHLCFINSQPSDTRTFQSSGPLTLRPGGQATIVVAYIFAPPVATGKCPSIPCPVAMTPNPLLISGATPDNPGVDAVDSAMGYLGFLGQTVSQDSVRTVPRSLLDKAKVAQSIFDSKFLLPFAPQSPQFFLVPGDNKVSIVWLPSPSECDNPINPTRGGDAYFAIANDPSQGSRYDPAYRQCDVEGYRIYRGRTDTPSQLELVAQFDYDTTTMFDFQGTINPLDTCAPELGLNTGCLAPFDSAPPIPPARFTDSVAVNLTGQIVQVRPGNRVLLANGTARVNNGPGAVDTLIAGGNSGLPALANTGVPFAFTDDGTGLLSAPRNNVRYFYAVTAFDVNSFVSGPASLESQRSARAVIPVKPASNVQSATLTSGLFGDDGVALDPGQPWNIDPASGRFIGTPPPTNGVAGTFAPLIEVLLPTVSITASIDSVKSRVFDDPLCAGTSNSLGVCYIFYVTFDRSGTKTSFTVPVPQPVWISFGAGDTTELTSGLGALPVLPDPATAARFGIPAGQGSANAAVGIKSRQYIQWSSFEGQAARRGLINSSILNVSPGGSRWYSGADETVDHPGVGIRVGHLDGVDTVWAPIHHTDVDPVTPGAQFDAANSGVIQFFGYGAAGLSREADVQITWGAGGVVESVRDLTHHVPVEFKPDLQASYGFVADGNGDGRINWVDFNFIPGMAEYWVDPDGAGFAGVDGPTDASEAVPLQPAPTITPVSTSFNPAGANTGDGFGLYIDGERYIFQLHGGAFPPAGAKWTLRTYTGTVTATNGFTTATPSGYTFTPRTRSPVVPGLQVPFSVDRPTMIAAATKGDLSLVHTVPDPYYVTNSFEATTTDKIIRFVNLPTRCIIRIYSSSGVLVQVLEHNSTRRGDSDEDVSVLGGEETWNVRNRNNQVVASGVYFYHIEAGDARRVGRFTVVNFAQ